MRKNIKVLLITLVFALSCMQPCYAFSTKEHMEKIEAVFWGEDGFAVEADSPAERRWKYLTNALYLCVDQHHTSDASLAGDQNQLSELKSTHRIAWLKNGLPSSISEIDCNHCFSGYHRKCTHLGWKHDYAGKEGKLWQSKWLLRRKILTTIINCEFHHFVNKDQLEAFCEWLYYLHIFEDLQYDVEYHEDNAEPLGTKTMFQRSGRILSLSQTIDCLVESGDLLFLSSKSQWSALKTRLSQYSNIAIGIGDTCETDAEFEQYKQCISEVREALIESVPTLIQQERFFKEAFPKL